MASTNTIDLRCVECTASWTMERRRGQYPSRCPQCVAAAEAQGVTDELATAARRAGLVADAYYLARLGEWVVRVDVPRDLGPPLLRDAKDLEWLLAEVGPGRCWKCGGRGTATFTTAVRRGQRRGIEPGDLATATRTERDECPVCHGSGEREALLVAV